MGKTNKNSVREKHKADLVQLPGCYECAKDSCKFNGQVATALEASHFDASTPYGCNSKLQKIGLSEVNENEREESH